MYLPPLYIGTSHEGCQPAVNYYFLASEDPKTYPPLLAACCSVRGTLQSVQPAHLELAFMQKHGLRANICTELAGLLAS